MFDKGNQIHQTVEQLNRQNSSAKNLPDLLVGGSYIVLLFVLFVRLDVGLVWKFSSFI